MHRVQIIPFHHHLSHLTELLGHAFLRYDELVFHIVVVFSPSPHLFHVLGIVRIVVDGGHGTQLVKAFNQHTFRVHVREAQWTDHFRHTFFAAPLLDGIEQCTRHVNVVDEVYPAKTYALAVPAFVGTAVNDGGNTTDNLAVAIGQEIICFAKLKGSILFLTKGVQLVAVQVGSIVLIPLVQVVMKLDEGIKFLLVGGFSNLYS